MEQHFSERINGLDADLIRMAAEGESRNKERIEAVRASLQAAINASETALVKASAAYEKRMDAGNEIRTAMIDQQKHFANKDTTDFRLRVLEDRIQQTKGKSEGFSSVGAVALGVLAGLSALSATATVIISVFR